jgi:hypothetical protein
MANRKRIDLKPCPYCNLTGSLKLFHHVFSDSQEAESEIRCFNCNIAMFESYPANTHNKEVEKEMKIKLINKWNESYAVRRKPSEKQSNYW